jgi:lipopolysaccharide export system protein LptA
MVEVFMKPKKGIDNAVLSGDVQVRSEGAQPVEASAGRAVLTFANRNRVTKIHAEHQVRLVQHQASEAGRREAAVALNKMPSLQQHTAQDIEITAPAIDLFVADGRRLTRAETIGSPQIELRSADNTAGQTTRVTADKFTAHFNSLGQLAYVHGEAHARVVTNGAKNNDPDRTSTSDTIEASFRPGSGIESLTQQGHFSYVSGTQQALAESGRYTPADQVLILNGSPRILDAGMSTTARSVRLNRSSGEGFADGEVKTTYNDLKPQPDGALLAASDPIHVTAQGMSARNDPAIATYSGDARLWQNANVIQAPSIQFEKDDRTVIATSKVDKKVSTVLVGTDKNGKATPVSITSRRLTYRDSERRARFEGGVTVHSSDMTITATQMDVFIASSPRPTGGTTLAPGSQNSTQSQPLGPARLDKIIASGSVLITEPNRRATGEQLTYTALDDKFVLTGGSPSIFDAERGNITGVSLTLFRRDDRVVVEGDSSSPAVTQTLVVR